MRTGLTPGRAKPYLAGAVYRTLETAIRGALLGRYAQVECLKACGYRVPGVSRAQRAFVVYFEDGAIGRIPGRDGWWCLDAVLAGRADRALSVVTNQFVAVEVWKPKMTVSTSDIYVFPGV